MKHLFLLLLISGLLCRCKKEAQLYKPVERSPDLTRNMDTILKYIHGDWVWLEEKRWDQINGRYIYLTPKTEGYTSKLKLVGDTAKFYKSDLPDSVYTFKIARENEVTIWYPEDTLPVIAYYGFDGKLRHYIPVKISKDQFLMQSQYVSSVVGEDLWRRE
jgi:hypothetical protein